MTCLDPCSGGSRPSGKGGPGHPHSKLRGGAVSSALWASFWPKHNGGAGLPRPLPWIRHCLAHWASKVYKLLAQQENLPVLNYSMGLFSSPGMKVRMK